MGLITNSGLSSLSVANLLRRVGTPLSILSFVLGLVFMGALAHPWVNERTYFSENALLPGLVKSSYNQMAAVSKYLDSLEDALQSSPSSFPHQWLESRILKLGLDPVTHNFSIISPLSSTATTTFRGRNIYTIMRAPRTTSPTEALVLNVPIRPLDSPVGTSSNAMGVALALSLLKHFGKQHYWAKDIIVLFSEHEQLGALAWLRAYHLGDQSEDEDDMGPMKDRRLIYEGDLEERAGSIQAAISLELTRRATHLETKVEGLNGQLPNLDLFNLVRRLCEREGVTQLFQNEPTLSSRDPRKIDWKIYRQALLSMSSMALKLALGMPSGNHGFFHTFGIEAVTIEGVDNRDRMRSSSSVPVVAMGRVMEGVYRSLNNLLERFHQSFFFYLLPSPDRYVSIGMYMPAFGLVVAPLVINAVALWFIAIQDEMKDEDESVPLIAPSGLSSIIAPWLSSHLIGFIAFVLPRLLVHPALKQQLETMAAIEVDLESALPLALVTLVILSMTRPLFKSSKYQEVHWSAVKCVVMIEMTLFLSLLSLKNFSQAFILAVVQVPLLTLARPFKNIFLRLLTNSVLVLFNPLAMLFWACLLSTWINFEELDWEESLLKTFEASKRAIVYSFVDARIFGNANYFVSTCVLLPCWIQIWGLVNSP